MNELLALALKVRAEVETELRGLPAADDLRNPDDFEGVCAIANYRLWLQLRRYGAQLAISNQHCFVLLHDDVIDLAATQFAAFKDQPVLIKPLKEILALPKVSSFYQNAQILGSKKDIRDVFEKWPRDQIPFELASV